MERAQGFLLARSPRPAPGPHAIHWREAKAKAKAAVAKLLPAVQRPGASQGRGAAQDAVIQNLTKKLEASGSLQGRGRAAAGAPRGAIGEMRAVRRSRGHSLPALGRVLRQKWKLQGVPFCPLRLRKRTQFGTTADYCKWATFRHGYLHSGP